MAYKIYRRVQVQEIKTEQVTPNLRPSDIAGDTFSKDSYYVTIAEFSNHESGTIHHLEKYIKLKQTISIAINTQRQVIAVINHTTGESGTADDSVKGRFQNHLMALLYTLPIACFGGWLLWRSIPFFDEGNDAGFIPAGFGAGALWLAIFIFRGYTREMADSGKALKELRLTKD